jgi:hypothetical protein
MRPVRFQFPSMRSTLMTKDDEGDLFGMVHLSEVLPKRPSRIQRRLIESSVQIEAQDPDSITYMHTVFCQTGLP